MVPISYSKGEDGSEWNWVVCLPQYSCYTNVSLFSISNQATLRPRLSQWVSWNLFSLSLLLFLKSISMGYAVMLFPFVSTGLLWIKCEFISSLLLVVASSICVFLSPSFEHITGVSASTHYTQLLSRLVSIVSQSTSWYTCTCSHYYAWQPACHL